MSRRREECEKVKMMNSSLAINGKVEWGYLNGAPHLKDASGIHAKFRYM